MADMSDPRVPLVLAHAQACRSAVVQKWPVMSLPPELKDLSNISLSHANLNTTNLLGAKLTNADLTLASLQGANLTGAKLNGADLTNAKFSGTKFNSSNVILLTRPASVERKPHLLLQPEKDGKLQIKRISLRY